jgi:Polyketide cyclase / dehydrase and lipid transport
MTTIHVVTDSPLPAARVLEAARDFSELRAEIWPAVSLEHMEVHQLGDASADVTEGTKAGVGVNWERCRYDWSQPGSVVATVTASNVYAVPGSRWELRATPNGDGSRIEMIWTREFTPTTRGRVFGTLFRLLGKPIFGRYARQTLANVLQLEQNGESGR